MSAFRVTLSGEVDILRRSELDAHAAAFEASSHRDCEVDLGQVEFMDSTGIGLLVMLQRIAARRGGTVCIVSIAPRPMRVLTITGLQTLVAPEAHEGQGRPEVPRQVRSSNLRQRGEVQRNA